MPAMYVPGDYVIVKAYPHPKPGNRAGFARAVYDGSMGSGVPKSAVDVRARVIGNLPKRKHSAYSYYIEPPVDCETYCLDASDAEEVQEGCGVPASAIAGQRVWLLEESAVFGLWRSGVAAKPKKSSLDTDWPTCKNCRTANQWAEATLPDNQYLCWSCKDDPFRLSPLAPEDD